MQTAGATRASFFSLFLVAAGLSPVSLDSASPGAAPDCAQTESSPRAGVYVPERVYDTRRAAFSDFEVMLAELSRADVVLVGEQHDDPNTHRLEAAILDGLLRRGASLALSLEMFERDVQPAVGAYAAGSIAEEEFLSRSRPWPRYATDYRELIEFAKAHAMPVIAANVPRRHAAAVAKSGLGALDTLAPAERAQIARDLQCPHDAYFERFSATMDAHPAPGQENQGPDERRATTERYYQAQCIKDETMAESIAAAVDQSGGRRGVVHFNGAFHSDFGMGVAERVRRRLPGRRLAIVSILPIADLDNVVPSSEDLRRADFLVYTVK